MKVITDNPQFSESILANNWIVWQESDIDRGSAIFQLISLLFPKGNLYSADVNKLPAWSYMIIAKSSKNSQYDIINELCEKNIMLPHGILCVSGAGKKFHGFKKRPWAAPAGNIYLTAFFNPNRPIENFGPGFMALAAVSVVETIDRLPGLKNRANIKWVNDIFIEGAKVGGVLAHGQQEGDILTGAALGIGLNVTNAPAVEPTPYVPRAASLSEFFPVDKRCDVAAVFLELIESLAKNYHILAESGYKPILNKYRQGSLIIGREVEIYSDAAGEDGELLASGVVESIGDGLELYLKSRPEPVSYGRLILKSV